MSTKLEQMVALAKCLKLGQPINYKGLTAKVEAFNDEGVFLSVEEIKVDPADFEGPLDAKIVKDKREEELKRRIYALENEIDRLLYAPRYRESRMNDEYRERNRMENYHLQMRAMRDLPLSKMPSAFDSGLNTKSTYIDPMFYKSPTQKKS